ncbi:hypothetical protein B0J13DRAFT_528899 [Dactylonectria estremocensis]|uniref:Uncharacterized protein n=1 Tax=Dactylonectria estremocensis TaxID=1079267 RepID=A0A9P9IV85_9HYPO|nr:hypothetical protein B0J13DRAFT_528899 [Dactylonectria estremocensis]
MSVSTCVVTQAFDSAQNTSLIRSRHNVELVNSLDKSTRSSPEATLISLRLATWSPGFGPISGSAEAMTDEHYHSTASDYLSPPPHTHLANPHGRLNLGRLTGDTLTGGRQQSPPQRLWKRRELPIRSIAAARTCCICGHMQNLHLVNTLNATVVTPSPNCKPGTSKHRTQCHIPRAKLPLHRGFIGVAHVSTPTPLPKLGIHRETARHAPHDAQARAHACLGFDNTLFVADGAHMPCIHTISFAVNEARTCNMTPVDASAEGREISQPPLSPGPGPSRPLLPFPLSGRRSVSTGIGGGSEGSLRADSIFFPLPSLILMARALTHLSNPSLLCSSMETQLTLIAPEACLCTDESALASLQMLNSLSSTDSRHARTDMMRVSDSLPVHASCSVYPCDKINKTFKRPINSAQSAATR